MPFPWVAPPNYDVFELVFPYELKRAASRMWISRRVVPSSGTLFLAERRNPLASPRNNTSRAMMHEAVSIRNSREGSEGTRVARPFLVQLTGAIDCSLQSTSTGALGIERSTRRSCDTVR